MNHKGQAIIEVIIFTFLLVVIISGMQKAYSDGIENWNALPTTWTLR